MSISLIAWSAQVTTRRRFECAMSRSESRWKRWQNCSRPISSGSAPRAGTANVSGQQRGPGGAARLLTRADDHDEAEREGHHEEAAPEPLEGHDLPVALLEGKLCPHPPRPLSARETPTGGAGAAAADPTSSAFSGSSRLYRRMVLRSMLTETMFCGPLPLLPNCARCVVEAAGAPPTERAGPTLTFVGRDLTLTWPKVVPSGVTMVICCARSCQSCPRAAARQGAAGRTCRSSDAKANLFSVLQSPHVMRFLCLAATNLPGCQRPPRTATCAPDQHCLLLRSYISTSPRPVPTASCASRGAQGAAACAWQPLAVARARTCVPEGDHFMNVGCLMPSSTESTERCCARPGQSDRPPSQCNGRRRRLRTRAHLQAVEENVRRAGLQNCQRLPRGVPFQPDAHAASRSDSVAGKARASAWWQHGVVVCTAWCRVPRGVRAQLTWSPGPQPGPALCRRCRGRAPADWRHPWPGSGPSGAS